MVNNEKGITLIEVTAVLALTGMIIAFFLYMFANTDQSVRQVTTRESVLQQSRDIMNHISTSTRKENGYTASQSSSADLRLQGPRGQYVKYQFDAKNHVLSAAYRLENESGTLQSERRQDFSDHVESVQFEVLHRNTQVKVTLTMRLPNQQTSTTSTVLNLIS